MCTHDLPYMTGVGHVHTQPTLPAWVGHVHTLEEERLPEQEPQGPKHVRAPQGPSRVHALLRPSQCVTMSISTK